MSEKQKAPGHESPPMPFQSNDPLRDVLGPGSSFTFKNAEEDEQAPPELQAVFDEYSIGQRTYRCILREVDENQNSAAYVESFNNEYPSVDYIGTRYGPGDYILIFMWRAKDPETQKSRNYSEKITVSISDKYIDRHEDYRLKKTIQRSQNRKEMVRRAKLKNVLDVSISDIGLESGPGMPSENEAGKKYFESISEGMKLLGIDPMALRPKPGIDWKELMPLLITGIPAIMKIMSDISNSRQQQLNTMLTLLMSQSNKSSDQLLEFVRASQGQGSGNQFIKEFTDMIKGTIDLKDVLSPEKQSVADRVFDAIDKVSPMILSIVAMNAQQRANNPVVNMAKNYVEQNPDFQAMKNDAEIQQQVIARLDTFFGWEQADIIIQIMGYQRSDANPRLPQQRYPQGSPERQRDEETLQAQRYDQNNEPAEEAEFDSQ